MHTWKLYSCWYSNTGYIDNIAMKATVTVFLFLCFFIVNTSLYRWHIYVNENMMWTDAQLYCRKYHDDLSTASNIEVKLVSANPKITSEYFWIGLQRDSQSPLLWKWSGGENASALHEQCAAVLKSNGKMHDAACFLSVPFFLYGGLWADPGAKGKHMDWGPGILETKPRWTGRPNLRSDDERGEE